MSLRKIVKTLLPRRLNELRRVYRRTRPLAIRECPICRYKGFFDNAGKPPRLDALCVECGSRERHRLFWLWLDDQPSVLAEPILHFAPEAILEKKFREQYQEYQTADLFSPADIRLNIEQMDLETDSVRTIICHQVLEHVDDSKALAEIERVLTDDGVLVCTVPIIEGWEHTYENNEVVTDFDRELHFGQGDHVRFYGHDFRDRLRAAGFQSIVEYTAEGQDVIRYGLTRGEKIFICRKS